MGHSFDMLTFDFLLKPPQPVTGLFLMLVGTKQYCLIQQFAIQQKILITNHNLSSFEKFF